MEFPRVVRNAGQDATPPRVTYFIGQRIDLVHFPATAYNPDSLKSWYTRPKKTIRTVEP